MALDTPGVDEIPCRAREQAAVAPSVRLPEDGDRRIVRSADTNKATCDGCSVRQECLSAALADPLTARIWGGMSNRDGGARGECRWGLGCRA